MLFKLFINLSFDLQKTISFKKEKGLSALLLNVIENLES